ncbi:MAG: DNA polymerase III subunit delta' [Pseudomonadota bacterium]
MARAPAILEPDAAPPEPDRAAPAPHPRHAPQVFGHDPAAAAFAEAWDAGRLHPAWLISGPRGIGKATLAWRLARAVLAARGAAGEAPLALDLPPDDPQFSRVASLGEPRLRLLRRGWDDKTKRLRTRIVAEDARALKTLFEQTAADGGWRVAVIDCLDETNPQAANALLKLIEEPPARALFLLIAHAPSRVLPTIRSRCRSLPLSPLAPDALGRALAQADPDLQTTPALAALAEGSAGEALRLAAQGGPALYAELAEIVARAPGSDRARWHAWAQAAAGRDGEARFDATLRLVALLCQRLARAGAGRPPSPAAAPEEPALASRLAAGPAQARLWAEAAQAIPARAAQARAVNLDPDRIVLDIFAGLDAAARKAAAAR